MLSDSIFYSANLKLANPLVSFSLKFSGFKRTHYQLMVCHNVLRFLPVVGDSRLYGLQEFRALWLLAQGCGKPTFSIKVSYNAGLLNKFVLSCVVDGKEKGELFGNHCWK